MRVSLLHPALLLLLAGCAPRKPVSPPAENASSKESAPVITLERTPCFGGCPVYRVAVSRSGAISYEGKAHVRRVGAATDQIQAERVEALLSELEAAGYFSFADHYTPAQPTCGRYSTDSPTAITTVRLNGRTKRIEHDYGCDAAPGALVALEQRIDEVLDSAQWTGQ
jgi:type IV pilus biogenesis protein CpaD/CtpE